MLAISARRRSPAWRIWGVSSNSKGLGQPNPLEKFNLYSLALLCRCCVRRVGAGLAQFSASFLQCLLRVAAGDFSVPGGVMGPGPGLSYRPSGHGLHGARLADGAEVNVNEDAGQHNQGRDVVNDVADGDGPAAEDFGEPHDHSCDDIGNAAADDLPEHRFLAGIEEANVGRLNAVAMR